MHTKTITKIFIKIIRTLIMEQIKAQITKSVLKQVPPEIAKEVAAVLADNNLYSVDSSGVVHKFGERENLLHLAKMFPENYYYFTPGKPQLTYSLDEYTSVKPATFTIPQCEVKSHYTYLCVYIYIYIEREMI